MTVVKYGGWEMIVPDEVAEDPVATAEIIAALRELNRVSDIEMAYELTL